MNRVCKILNIEKPVIQGPMAWIVVTVCNTASLAKGIASCREIVDELAEGFAEE